MRSVRRPNPADATAGPITQAVIRPRRVRADRPHACSVIDSVRATSLYCTAFYVLGEQGFETPIADEITAWLKPNPSGRAA